MTTPRITDERLKELHEKYAKHFLEARKDPRMLLFQDITGLLDELIERRAASSDVPWAPYIGLKVKVRGSFEELPITGIYDNTVFVHAAPGAETAAPVGWTVTGPDGCTFNADTPFRAAVLANRHRVQVDPVAAQQFADMIEQTRRGSEEANSRLIAEHGTLNCPACGGSGYVGDVVAVNETSSAIQQAVAEALARRDAEAVSPERLLALIAAVPDIGDKSAREFTIARMAAADAARRDGK